MVAPFVIHCLSVIALIWISEFHRNHEEEGEEHGAEHEEEHGEEHEEELGGEHGEAHVGEEVGLYAAKIITSILNLINLVLFIRQTIAIRWLQLKRGWAYMDLIIIATNLGVTYSLFFEVSTIDMRILEAILIACLLGKSLYFMMLNSEISPLINIILTVLKDINYFMVILIISEVAFVISFYLIGRNQKDILHE